MLLSFTIRINTEWLVDSDMGEYSRMMRMDEIPILFYREFIFFLGINYTYKIFGNEVIVFMILDFLFYIFLFNGITKIKKIFFSNIKGSITPYIYFAFLLFFPIVLGFHNTYRQLFAFPIFIMSYSYIANKRYFLSFIIFLVSVFIHNSSLYFLPLLLFSIPKKITKILSWVAVFSIAWINLRIVSDAESNVYLSRSYTENNEGDIFAYIYIFAISSIIFLLTIIDVFYRRIRKKYFTWITIMLLILYLSSVISFSGGVSKRVAFIVFSFLFPITVYYIEQGFKDKRLARFIFLNVSILPIIFLHNTTIDLSPFF